MSKPWSRIEFANVLGYVGLLRFQAIGRRGGSVLGDIVCRFVCAGRCCGRGWGGRGAGRGRFAFFSLFTTLAPFRPTILKPYLQREKENHFTRMLIYVRKSAAEVGLF